MFSLTTFFIFFLLFFSFFIYSRTIAYGSRACKWECSFSSYWNALDPSGSRDLSLSTILEGTSEGSKFPSNGRWGWKRRYHWTVSFSGFPSLALPIVLFVTIHILSSSFVRSDSYTNALDNFIDARSRHIITIKLLHRTEIFDVNSPGPQA